MAISEFDTDMNIIQQLSDEPNDVDGLAAAELKAKFDEGGNALKTYINGTLIPGTETEIDAKVSAAELASGNIPVGGTSGQTLVKNSDTDYDAGWGIPSIDIAHGGTGASTAEAALDNLISALSTVTPVSGDKFPFLSVAGGTSGSVTLENLFKAFETLGALKTAITSYTGTGTYGSANPSSLTFDFKPEIVIIYDHYNCYLAVFIKNSPKYMEIQPNGAASYTITNWDPITWYATNIDTQLNHAGKTYYVFAAGRDDV